MPDHLSKCVKLNVDLGHIYTHKPVTDTFRFSPARKRETNSLVDVHGYSDNTSDGFDGLESKYCRSRQRHWLNVRGGAETLRRQLLFPPHITVFDHRRSQTFARSVAPFLEEMKNFSNTGYQIIYFLFYVIGLVYTSYNISINVRSYLNHGALD